jgi:hypothetical protein
MHSALAVFQKNINDTLILNSIHEHLERNISNSAPISFDDILRSKFVYSVSAFDKLMHDIIRLGMVEIFKDARASTPKYLSEVITLQTYKQLINATTPPAEYIFSQFILSKLKFMSFQAPDKIADGLSYIWNENQKWLKISQKLNLNEQMVKTTLSLISSRRNCIVHEADMEPINNQKYPITKQECDDVTNFLLNTGNAIAELVI